MLSFLIRRLAGLIFVLFGVLLLTFVVAHAAPGDPVQTILGQRHDPALYARLRHFYGLDQPLPVQFISYLGGVLHGSFGYSYHFTDTPVSTLLWRYIPVTLQLGIPALALSTILGVPLGVLAAARRNTALDTLSMGVALIFYAVPTFVLIPILLTVDLWLHDHQYPFLPVEGWGSLSQAIMPVAVLAAPNVAYIARLTRTSILGVLREDYIRTARSKGLPGRVIIFKHALRVALLPIVTYLAPAIALLITSTFVVENLFNIPGVGFAVVFSLLARDYPLAQGLTVIIAAFVVIMTVVSDILYSVLDPRIGAPA
jgi:peptide/nickel transport system permease protein/oligopeptide transport system permease protein